MMLAERLDVKKGRWLIHPSTGDTGRPRPAAPCLALAACRAPPERPSGLRRSSAVVRALRSSVLQHGTRCRQRSPKDCGPRPRPRVPTPVWPSVSGGQRCVPSCGCFHASQIYRTWRLRLFPDAATHPLEEIADLGKALESCSSTGLTLMYMYADSAHISSYSVSAGLKSPSPARAGRTSGSCRSRSWGAARRPRAWAP